MDNNKTTGVSVDTLIASCQSFVQKTHDELQMFYDEEILAFPHLREFIILDKQTLKEETKEASERCEKLEIKKLGETNE